MNVPKVAEVNRSAAVQETTPPTPVQPPPVPTHASSSAPAIETSQIVPPPVTRKALAVVRTPPATPTLPVAAIAVRQVSIEAKSSIKEALGNNGSVTVRAGYSVIPKPVYPKAARLRGQEGTVVVSVLISREGRSERAEVVQGSGHALLDQAALKAVNDCRFTPARIGGTTVVSRVEIPIRFKLSD